MGAKSIRIAGADSSITNQSGNNYAGALQASAQAARLYKLSISPLAGGGDVYVWAYDLAAGTVASAAPVAVRYVPAGLADTWDFGPDGSLFANGIYFVVSTVAPTNATTAPTAAGNNQVILKAEFRQFN